MKKMFLSIATILCSTVIVAQSVGINNPTPDASAILDIQSTSKGMLAPRLTLAQRNLMPALSTGLLIYQTDNTPGFYYYNGSAWSNLSTTGINGSGISNYLSKFNTPNTIGSSQLFDNGTNVGINTVSPIGKFHIKGSADAWQLVVDANATQSNTNPLINLRKSDGTNLMWINSDNPFNTFMGLYAGSVNNAAGGALYNTFVGRDAGASNSTGYANTAHGFQALQQNTTGVGNTAIGVEALQSNTTGKENTAIGAEALQLNNGVENAAIGYRAMWLNTTGSDNTANGHSALFNNNGSANCATGAFALYTNAGATYNTANGYEALYYNTVGSYNTSTGAKALFGNSTGEYNTANGSYALMENTTGSENTAIGAQALFNNSSANRNTAIGNNALFSQAYTNGGTSWESANVAVGYNALYSNQPISLFEGVKNTAIGSYALQGNTEGRMNTALGYASLVSNTTGSGNTASGYNALYSNGEGAGNTGIGWEALNANISGSENNAFGYSSLFNNTTGSDNVAIGFNALVQNIGGSNNIAIGSNAGNSGSYLNNNVGIGNGGYPIGSSNTVILGNGSTGFIGGAVGFTNQSDARIKNTIQEDVKGLEFILQLRPVTYHVSVKAITAITGNKATPDFPEKYDREKIKYSGFIAQEVEQAAKTVGYDFSGVYIPTKSTELYGLRYAEFVVPLVKAVQEQQVIIKTQQQQIDQLLKRMDALEKINR